MSQERPTPPPGVGESPWSKEAPPSAVLPPAPPGAPHRTAASAAPGWTPNAGPPRRRYRAGAALRWIAVVGLSAGVASALTMAMNKENAASPPVPPPSSSTPAPQVSAADAASAKQNLCHIVDLSVGQKSEGGFRVQGNLNVPVILKAVNSVSAVQNALVPALPTDVAAAARRYISTTLDVTTAAMGTVPASEVNRLTDISNDAMYALVDTCGLPR